jgi:hypothetical protein
VYILEIPDQGEAGFSPEIGNIPILQIAKSGCLILFLPEYIGYSNNLPG